MGVPTATRGHPGQWVSTQGRRGCPTAFSRNRPTFRWNENDARVRIGVCSDVHGRHDRLLAVLAAMAAAGVDERWCLGDLVGREPVTAELVGAASQLDLLIAGNHDAWALGPTGSSPADATCSGCRAAHWPAVTASTAGTARRATPCSGSSLRRLPPESCLAAPWDRSDLSAIRMNRPSSFTTAPLRARCGLSRASLTTGSQPVPSWPTRGRSAATHATRRAGGSSSTLTPA